jgi:organic radical activating enzyme
MECKFLSHGFSLKYDKTIVPCCSFVPDSNWITNNQIDNNDLANWHNKDEVKGLREQLSNDIWPKECYKCKNLEEQGRGDSTRLNGDNSYGNYVNDDLTLEIRPGNTCNLACQTCWPEASSRVYQYHVAANLIKKENISISHKNFDMLEPVKHRIKDVVVLGGEPFYDKNCLKFFNWASNNLQANLVIFTNGSVVDYNFIENYRGKVKLVFSIDSIGKSSEYIRFGSNWEIIKENYIKCKKYNHVEICVNVTISVYNVFYLNELIEFLCEDWNQVTFGVVQESHLQLKVIPLTMRKEIINQLTQTVITLLKSNIEKMQKINAINAMKNCIEQLSSNEYDEHNHKQFIDFVNKMDTVKKIKSIDYSNFLSQLSR